MHRHSLSIISDAKSYASVDKLVLKLAAAYLTGAELTLFTNLANSMNNSANSGAVKIFDTSSKNIDKCNFQLGVADMVNESITLNIGYFTYSAGQEIDNVLFFKLGTQDVTFLHGHQAMILNETHYAQLRQSVKDKLGVNTTTYIADLKL